MLNCLIALLFNRGEVFVWPAIDFGLKTPEFRLKQGRSPIGKNGVASFAHTPQALGAANALTSTWPVSAATANADAGL